MKCKKHNWTNLFNAPVSDASMEIKEKWAGMVMFEDAAHLRICSCCGAVGIVSRGFSKGGGRAIKPAFKLWGDLELDAYNLNKIAELKARAEKWNATNAR